ncbi:MAG: tRNA (adenosine(37)-N6)-dimethylallyltransferase MiaA [Muribaculaceae bacterium]|nr:tRNA (adenosine(37)-N6)-dimethylallyltransferase MiaA [Muribaculaceae bacterium]
MVERQKSEIPKKNKLIAIVGPTASGKTSRAVAVCKSLGGEIISADSRQVYRGMTIGTGKDLEEYGEVPYHLIDICNAGEKYNLHDYIKAFCEVLADLENRGVRGVICGGSGMYVEMAISGISLPDVPQNTRLRKELENKSLEELTLILKRYKSLHNTTDVDNAKRAIRAIEIEDYYHQHPELSPKFDRNHAKPLDCVVVGIDIPREVRRKRISERLHSRLEQGMIDEVRNLLDAGLTPEQLIYYGLEYKYLTNYIVGNLSYSEMVRQLEIAIHQFAKRQMTWFRGMEKRGFKINWLPFDMQEEEFVDSVRNLTI